MKRKLLFTAIAIIGFATATMAQVPSYVPSNGLIGYFGFNNNGNDAISSSIPSSNTAVSSIDRFGNANSAYQFNGSNIIKYTNSSHPFFNIGNTYQTFTINFWINPSITGNASILGAFGWGYSVNLTTNNKIQFTYISANSPATWTTLTSSSTVLPNNWQMITITRTGTTNSIYINGILNSTLTSAPNILVYTNNNCWFGANGQDNNNYLTGKLDDIGLWNRALTQQEITALFQGSNNINVPSYVPSNGLVGWWPFNGNANDESGNGNNGVVNGATLTNDRFGNLNNSYNFNGIDNHITISNAVTSLITNEYSISFWILTSDTSLQIDGHEVIADRDITTFDFKFRMTYGIQQLPFLQNTYLQTCSNSNSTCFGVNTSLPSISVWEHYVISYNNSNTFKAYRNGVLLDSVTNVSFSAGNRQINIGRSVNPANPSGIAYYNGLVDDIGIWNRALTQQEITALYQGCNGVLVSTQPSNQNINLGSNAQFITSASNSTTTYQWQTDLGFGFQNISNAGQYNGANNDTLIVSNTQLSNNNQQFRCIVTDGGCKDTSNVATLTIANIGINETSQNQFKVYPNPATNQINVQVNQSMIGSSYSITDQIGKTVLSGKLNTEKSTIELGDLSGGIYLFSIGNNAKQTFKVIKK